MPTVLITGAGRGLGLELARQYAEDGWTVLAGVRSTTGANHLSAIDGDVAAVSLDVADPASVTILAERMRGIAIDLLINNAGVYGPRAMTLGDLDYAAWRDVLEVNLLGTLRVTEAFLDHVLTSDGKKIAFLTSKMGSIADNSSGGVYAYRSSKSALNAAVRSLAIDLAPQDVAVTLLHPGWVRTDMGGAGALIDVIESVTGMRRVIDTVGPDKTGRFWNYDGRELPW